MIPKLLRAGKARILLFTGVALATATLLDWITGQHVSMAPLYIVPMMLGALVLRKPGIAGLAVLCALLRAWFDVPGPTADLVLRFIFATAAYLVSALFVTALVKNHQLALAHVEELRIEQARRRDAEEQLRLLVASSPAAIFILDPAGIVLTANDAARRLLAIADNESLIGQRISSFVPFFADALQADFAGLRAAVRCQGDRASGEPFSADIWLSSYRSAEGKRLAAIMADSSEEMRDREEQGLLNIRTGNRIATAAIAHEVRNFCQAIGMVSQDLFRRYPADEDDALRRLARLIEGLENIASLELGSSRDEQIRPVDLREVLHDLRIVIEPEWRDIAGSVEWRIPTTLPAVLGEPHGLLQACLNLAQNSLRAVQNQARRTLQIVARPREEKVFLEFIDSGPGVADPQLLFRPFNKSASGGAGLGLYISRFIVRAYGGELRFAPEGGVTRFVIELEAV